MQNKILHIVEKINYYLFILAICALPFPTRISLYLWEAWAISWLFEGRFLRKENIQWHKGIVPLVLLATLVLWEAISCIWAINLNDATNMLVRHISFIFIVPIAIWGVNKQYDWGKAITWFIISSIVSIFIYGIYLYVIQHWGYLQEHHCLPEYVSSWSYFGEKVSSLKHRLYYGTVLNLAIVALLHVRVPLLSIRHHHRLITCCFLLSLFALVIGIILTGSRANILTLLLISAVAIIQPLRGRTRIIGSALVVAVGIAVCALLFTLHPRFEKLELEHITDRATYQTYEIEPRINIWYSALHTPQDYFWYGVGAGGNSEYLKPIYASFNWVRFHDRAYNAHNQYLGVLINLGIFAAILFLLIWLLYPLWYKGRLRQAATLVVLVLGSNMLTENMLDRIDGVIITSCALVTIALLSRAQLAK